MPRQYFFWKYLNTIIVRYCIIVQKSPNFVQLSPIQCTYSNIFIRFFKFFPANTNIYQNSYSVIGVLCGLRQGVLSSQCGYLISFGTKYLMSLQCGVPSGRLPRYARNDKVLRTEWKPLQKRLKCLCGIQNKPNKHYTVLKLIIFIHTLLNSGHRTISP